MLFIVLAFISLLLFPHCLPSNHSQTAPTNTPATASGDETTAALPSTEQRTSNSMSSPIIGGGTPGRFFHGTVSGPVSAIQLGNTNTHLYIGGKFLRVKLPHSEFEKVYAEYMQFPCLSDESSDESNEDSCLADFFHARKGLSFVATRKQQFTGLATNVCGIARILSNGFGDSNFTTESKTNDNCGFYDLVISALPGITRIELAPEDPDRIYAWGPFWNYGGPIHEENSIAPAFTKLRMDHLLSRTPVSNPFVEIAPEFMYKYISPDRVYLYNHNKTKLAEDATKSLGELFSWGPYCPGALRLNPDGSPLADISKELWPKYRVCDLDDILPVPVNNSATLSNWAGAILSGNFKTMGTDTVLESNPPLIKIDKLGQIDRTFRALDKTIDIPNTRTPKEKLFPMRYKHLIPTKGTQWERGEFYATDGRILHRYHANGYIDESFNPDQSQFENVLSPSTVVPSFSENLWILRPSAPTEKIILLDKNGKKIPRFSVASNWGEGGSPIVAVEVPQGNSLLVGGTFTRYGNDLSARYLIEINGWTGELLSVDAGGL